MTRARSPRSHPLPDLAQEVVDLPRGGTHLHHRVEQAGGADQLLGQLRRVLQLVRAGRGGDEDHLVEVRLELLEGEGAVVQGRGEAEAVVHQGLLAGAVAGEHAPGLGHGHVQLVHEHEVVVREVVQQRPRGLPRGPAGEVPGVVLDPQADPRLPQHLQVEAGALLQALRLQELVALLHPLQALVQLLLDGHHRPLQHLRRGDEVPRGVDVHALQRGEDLPGEGVDLDHAVDLVPEELHPHGEVVVGGEDLQHLPPHAVLAPGEAGVVALVLDVVQVAQEAIPAPHLPALEVHRDGAVGLGGADAVDAGDAGHDQDVPALEEGAGGGEAQLLDLLVERGVLLDVGVRAGDVGLGLVVVVVRDEVLHRVVREELPELPVQLRGERLVGGQHQRRALQLLHHRGDGVRLPRPRGAQQRLRPVPRAQRLRQLGDGLGLIPRGPKLRHQLELRHASSPLGSIPLPEPR